MPWMKTQDGSPPPRADFPGWFVFGLIAIAVAGLLAMVATWNIVADYPLPDDSGVYLALLVVLFIVLFDFFLVCYVAGSKVRQGQHKAAVKWSATLILLGLLAAAVVASLPWLCHRLVVAMPWVADVDWGLLIAVMLALSSSIQLVMRAIGGHAKAVPPS